MPENTIKKSVVNTYKAVYGSEKIIFGKWLGWFGITKGILNTKFITLFADWAAWSGDKENLKKKQEGSQGNRNPKLGFPDDALINNFYEFLDIAYKDPSTQGDTKTLIEDISKTKTDSGLRPQVIRGLRVFGDFFVLSQIRNGTGKLASTQFEDALKKIRTLPGLANGARTGQKVSATESNFAISENEAPLSTAEQENSWDGLNINYDDFFNLEAEKTEQKTKVSSEKVPEKTIPETGGTIPIPTEKPEEILPGTTTASPSKGTSLQPVQLGALPKMPIGKIPTEGTASEKTQTDKSKSKSKKYAWVKRGTSRKLIPENTIQRTTNGMPVKTTSEGYSGMSLEEMNSETENTKATQTENPRAKTETQIPGKKPGMPGPVKWGLWTTGGGFFAMLAAGGSSGGSKTAFIHTILDSISHVATIILSNLF